MRQLERMAIVLALVGVGCGSEDGGPGLTGEPPENPTTGYTTTSTSGTTSGSSEDTGVTECGVDQPCPDDQFCAAPHQAGLFEPAGEFVCRSECIPAGSKSFWCLDDDGCCGAATCDARFGLCEGTDESTTGTETSTGDTDASTGGTDASTSDASTSDASTTDGGTTDGGETTSESSSSTG